MDEDVVLCHPDALVGEQDRGEHRESFRNCADHDGYRDGDGLKDERNPSGKISRECSGDEGLEENACDDASCAPVAELRDLIRELSELDLERSAAGVFLHLKGELAEHGLVAHNLDGHVGLALAHYGAAVDEVLVEKVRGVIGGSIGAGYLLSLLGLAVEAGLIDLDLALDNLAVRAELVSGLQEYEISGYELADMDLLELSVADDLGSLLGLLLLLERGCASFLLALAD